MHEEGTQYPCKKYDLVVIKKEELCRHFKSKHEKVMKYKCDSCQYKSYRKDCLKLHVSSEHVKMKFQCEHCSFQATTITGLTKHKHLKHEKKQFL